MNNPVAILYALSIGCFILAGLILCYLIFDWVRVSRRIKADMSFDPIRRPEPDWMKNAHVGVDYAKPGSERTVFGTINPKTGELELVVRQPKFKP